MTEQEEWAEGKGQLFSYLPPGSEADLASVRCCRGNSDLGRLSHGEVILLFPLALVSPSG